MARNWMLIEINFVPDVWMLFAISGNCPTRCFRCVRKRRFCYYFRSWKSKFLASYVTVAIFAHSPPEEKRESRRGISIIARAFRVIAPRLPRDKTSREVSSGKPVKRYIKRRESPKRLKIKFSPLSRGSRRTRILLSLPDVLLSSWAFSYMMFRLIIKSNKNWCKCYDD